MKNITENKIVEKALELFNRNGIEYVGMRELAAELGLRIGNITYYFPTKDDLVYRLSNDLSELNSKVIVENEDISISGILKLINQIFVNQIKYKCLYLSFVHIIRQNKKLVRKHKKTAQSRITEWVFRITKLQKNGYLRFESKKEIEFLASTIALIGRFWLSEAKTHFTHLSQDKLIRNYLEMMARILLPYTTAKGKKEIRNFIEEK